MLNYERIAKNDEYLKLLVSEGAKTTCDGDDFELKLPEWADQNKIKQAQLFFVLNLNASIRGILLGLLQIIPEDSIIRILEFTKQSSTPRLAFKRYRSTSLHGQIWSKFKFQPGTRAWDSFNYVRNIHLLVNRRADKNGIGIVSQKDMAITQFAFVGIQLLYPEKLGLKASREQLKIFCHYWRVIGYLLGIQDRFNICDTTLNGTLSRLKAVKENLLLPNFIHLNPKTEEYLRIAVEGMKGFEPWLHSETQLFTIKRLLEVPGYHFHKREAITGYESKQVYKSLSFMTRLRITTDVIIYEYLSKIWAFRWCFNISRMIFSVFDYFPIFAIIKFGRKYAYVEILKSKSPKKMENSL